MAPRYDTKTYTTNNAWAGVNKKTGIVLHSTEGNTAEDSAAWLCNPTSQVSAHEVIRKDGVIYKLAYDDVICWHAGVYNQTHIGIEQDHKEGNATGPWTPADKDALRESIKEKIRLYGIQQRNIVAHRWIQPQDRRDPTDWPDADLKAFIASCFATPTDIDYSADVAQGKAIATIFQSLYASASTKGNPNDTLVPGTPRSSVFAANGTAYQMFDYQVARLLPDASTAWSYVNEMPRDIPAVQKWQLTDDGVALLASNTPNAEVRRTENKGYLFDSAGGIVKGVAAAGHSGNWVVSTSGRFFAAEYCTRVS